MLRLPAVATPVLHVERLEAAAVAAAGYDDFGSPSYRRRPRRARRIAQRRGAALRARRRRARRPDHRDAREPAPGDRLAWRPSRRRERAHRGTAGGDRPPPHRHHPPRARCSDAIPGRRPLVRWESADSIPPPETATFHTDPRIEATRGGHDDARRAQPGIQGHPLRPRRRTDRVRDAARAALREHIVGDAGQHADVRRVAPRRRRDRTRTRTTTTCSRCSSHARRDDGR